MNEPGVNYYLITLPSDWRGRQKQPKIVGRFNKKENADKARQDRLDRTPEHVRCENAVAVVSLTEYQQILQQIKGQQAKRRTEGAKKAAAERKKNGTKPKFILCPTCNAKSKKLFSEMGGLQTRRCQNGHSFEVDTYFGFETHKRRVENTDRPFMVGGNYNDYVYGRFKDDPSGKGGK